MTIDLASAVPLLIGVVGSGDTVATDVPGLGETFAAVLLELRNSYPDLPLVLLSGATQGAVAAVIRVAADRGLATTAIAPTPEAIVAASDLLIVVARDRSTAEELALTDRPPGRSAPSALRALLAPPDRRPCFVLAGGSVERAYPPQSDFAAELARRNRFNADLRSVSEPEDRDMLERLRQRTDLIAGALQARTDVWQRFLYAIAFVAASVQIITVIPNGVWIKFGAVVVALSCYFFVRRQDYQNRYQDYRAISEALRVQIVWSAVGIGEGVAESYLPMQQTDLLWIRNVLRVVHVIAGRAEPAAGTEIVFDWVASQRSYFRDHAQAEARRRARLDRWAATFGISSLVVSLIMLCLSLAHLRWAAGAVVLLFGIFTTWCALVVAIVISYARTRGHAENANRYQRMFFVFDRALGLLNGTRDRATQCEVAHELGRMALAEQAEWLLQRRERPISLVYANAA